MKGRGRKEGEKRGQAEEGQLLPTVTSHPCQKGQVENSQRERGSNTPGALQPSVPDPTVTVVAFQIRNLLGKKEPTLFPSISEYKTMDL